MEHTTKRRTLARLPSGVEIATTVHIYDGSEEGPTVYVQAAQHGREINGTEVLREEIPDSTWLLRFSIESEAVARTTKSAITAR